MWRPSATRSIASFTGCSTASCASDGKLAVDVAVGACYLHDMRKQQLTWWRKSGFVLGSGALMLMGALMHAACEDSKGAHASSQKPEDLAEVLAKVDDVTITVGEFQERINQQSPYVRARYTSLERKKEFLDNLVRFEVLAKEADRRGLSKDPEVVRTMKQVMIQKLLKDELDKQKMEDISDAECKKYFEAHPEDYNKAEEVRVSSILVKDSATAKKVLGDARIKGVDNQQFRNLVAEFSQDLATKDRGGDLRYFDAKTKDVPKEIVDAAFKLQNIGDVSETIRTSQGIVILKLTGRRKAVARNFDEVKQQIRNKIYRDKRQESMETFTKGLREKSNVKIDEAKLAKVQIEGIGAGQFPGPGVPPPGPGQFHPGAPGAPQATPVGPGNPAGASTIALPPPGSPKAPEPANK
jgi:peptidyl-prolyl cis-trans isomerase C